MILVATGPPTTLQQGPYIYDTLDAQKPEIRLYATSDDTDAVMRKLQKVELDSEQETIIARSVDRFKNPVIAGVPDASNSTYNALSYNWGNEERVGQIILNGHHFPVTNNLEAALRQFR